MKNVIYLLALVLLSACGSSESVRYRASDVSASGEFLFEGPNTLQGQLDLNLEAMAEQLSIAPEKINAVYIISASVFFEPDSLQRSVESALVQLVSNDLPLVSVATRSPFPPQGSAMLEVNSEQDVLSYLKDPTTTLVVDVNLDQDIETLGTVVSFELNVEF